ncbi:hypothetical protein Tco_0335555 [Tanacetum coccineum]
MMRGEKLVKKELIVALKGELYFVKFIINSKEDDVEPGVILRRSFLILAKGIVDFGNGVITIHPKPDPFDDDSEKTVKSSDDWDQLLDFNFDDIPKFGKELPSFVCKIGKSNQNKKKVMENLDLFYQDIRPSSSSGRHLTQGEAERKHWIQGEALKEKYDPGSFIFPIRFEGKVNENALADTGSDMNTMPYRIYEQLGRDDLKNEDRGITMINHTQAEVMGRLSNVLCQTLGTHDDEAGSLRSKRSRHEIVEEVLLPQVHHEFLLWEGCTRDAKSRHQKGYANVAWVITKWMKRKGAGTQKESQICCGQFISKLARKCRVLTEDVVRSLSDPIYCRDLDKTTLRDLIDSDGKLIPEDPQPVVPRVGIPRPPRASMQDLYDRMGRMQSYN